MKFLLKRCALASVLAVGSALAFSPIASAEELTVSAAASLQNVMREIGSAYQSARPGAKIHFNFAASGALLAQIAQGAPADVLATADAETMDRAQAQRLIAVSTRVNFAANELVLVSPLAQPATVTTLADLSMPAVQRIALGTPTSVPAGRYAQTALERQGLWTTLQPKMVYADNVRQVLNYVGRAEAEAGFVYRTDALVDRAKVRLDLVVPTADRVVYPIAAVAASTQARAATDFVRFVDGPAGRAVLDRHGFARP